MKALIVIASSILLAFVLRVIDVFSNGKRIRSVGAKANKEFKNIPTVNITDDKELKEAMNYYKSLDLID